MTGEGVTSNPRILLQKSSDDTLGTLEWVADAIPCGSAGAHNAIQRLQGVQGVTNAKTRNKNENLEVTPCNDTLVTPFKVKKDHAPSSSGLLVNL